MKQISPLYDQGKVEDMSPVTRELDKVIKATGFTMDGIGRIMNSGNNNNIDVNRLEYLKGNERIFLTTHEPSKTEEV